MRIFFVPVLFVLMLVAAAKIGWLALIPAVSIGVWLGLELDRLRAQVSIDALTHIANRRHFEARLRHDLAAAARYGTHLCLLILDVDHLKIINDARGHAEGDDALRVVADALRRCCRAPDTAGRIGGDEFAVLAPMTRAAEGLALAQRIRQTINDPQVTVSVGVADLEAAGRVDAGALWSVADAALYAAKTTGRDRVVVAPPSPLEGITPLRPRRVDREVGPVRAPRIS